MKNKAGKHFNIAASVFVLALVTMSLDISQMYLYILFFVSLLFLATSCVLRYLSGRLPHRFTQAIASLVPKRFASFLLFIGLSIALLFAGRWWFLAGTICLFIAYYYWVRGLTETINENKDPINKLIINLPLFSRFPKNPPIL